MQFVLFTSFTSTSEHFEHFPIKHTVRTHGDIASIICEIRNYLIHEDSRFLMKKLLNLSDGSSADINLEDLQLS